jgi:hypothetical protein
MNDVRTLWRELKQLSLADRLRVSWLTITGQRAKDGRMARMVVLNMQLWFRFEAAIFGLAAATGRATLGLVLLNWLSAPASVAGWHLINANAEESRFIVRLWVAAAALALVASVIQRRGLRLNDPIATPPVEYRVRPVTTARTLTAAHAAMVLVLVFLCLLVRRLSPIWTAYFLAEALLLVATTLVGLRPSIRLASGEPRLKGSA